MISWPICSRRVRVDIHSLAGQGGGGIKSGSGCSSGGGGVGVACGCGVYCEVGWVVGSGVFIVVVPQAARVRIINIDATR